MFPDEASCCGESRSICVNLNWLQDLIQGLPKQEFITSLEVSDYWVSIRYSKDAIR